MGTAWIQCGDRIDSIKGTGQGNPDLDHEQGAAIWCDGLDYVFNHPYFIHMNARQVLIALKAAGWIEVRSKGSHVQLKHSSKPGLVTLPMHGARDIKPGTLASIERQAGMKLRNR